MANGRQSHRTSEIARFAALLTAPTPGLSICSVSGPGGVGKSYLLDAALAEIDPMALGWLVLRCDASSAQARRDFFALLGQLAPRALPPPAAEGTDYFPRLRKVAQAHEALLERVQGELQALDGAPDEVKEAAVALLRAGRRLNRLVPLTRQYLDVGALGTEEDLTGSFDAAWLLMDRLEALRDSHVLPAPVRDALGLSQRGRVRTDLYAVTAEALVGDLTAATVGWKRRKKDFWRITQAPIPGMGRVLLVLDDFEATGPLIEEFVVGALVPELARAPFPVLLLVLGRDDIEAMHPGWAQHCSKHLKERIRVEPFDQQTALALMEAAGIPAQHQPGLFEASQGFPFLLASLIEEWQQGGGSALFLRRFVDRTTRWMSPRERGWFERVCYLPQVDLRTLSWLFPADEARRVQDWFEREASIRDPQAPVFAVRPLIREKLLRYQEVRDPDKHAATLALVARQGAPA